MNLLNSYKQSYNRIGYITKKYVFAILCFSCMHVLFGQSTFQKAYGIVYNSNLVFAQETTDGNIIAAGTNLPGNVSTPPYTLPGIRERMSLIKTDMNGDTLWTKTFGGIDHYRCDAMHQTMDNGFILGGRVVDSIVGDSKMILIKTDSNGNLIWSQTYNSSDINEEIFAIKETAGGDYFIAGRGFVGKVTAIGNLIWAKDLKTPNINLNLRSLDNTYDGGVILGGSVDTVGTPSYSYMIKMNGAGSLLWAKAYSSIHNMYEEGYSVSETTDKGFILTGLTYYPVGPNTGINHMYLVKTDSLGNLTWSKKFASDGNDTGYDVKQTADGGYIVTGYSTGIVGNGLVTSNAILIKTNASGMVSWCKYYGMIINSGEVPASVAITSDGGYLVSGTTTDNMGYPQRLYLLKTDVSGNVNCNGYSWPLYDSIYTSVGHSNNQPALPINLTQGTPLLNETHFLCNSYDACTVGTTGLVDALHKDLDVVIAPNPTNGVVVISSLHLLSNVKIEVMDGLGKILMSQHQDELDNATINIGHLASGIYFVKIYAGDKVITKKIIKE